MTEFLTDVELAQRDLDAEREAYDTEEAYQAWVASERAYEDAETYMNERALDDDADAYYERCEED